MKKEAETDSNKQSYTPPKIIDKKELEVDLNTSPLPDEPPPP